MNKTMTTTRIEHQERHARLSAASRLVENLALRYPSALAHALEEIRALDGWAGGSDDPKVTTTTSTPASTKAGEQRAQVLLDIASIEAGITMLAAQAGVLREEIDQLAGKRLSRQPQPTTERIAPQLCDCLKRDGAELPWTPGAPLADGNGWSNPECREVASRGSLCDTCSRREQRWREHHNLPLRKDGALTDRPDNSYRLVITDGVAHVLPHQGAA